MSDELIDLIKQVVTSWQVIVVTIAFILFWSLVSSAANPYKRPKMTSNKPRKLKRPKEKTPALDKDIDTGDLGLGE